ncbi:RNA polymerase sigma factor [Rhodococcus sp. ACT016]|uniref:RNA polymerase sigma factor n=1 Tax=Rhodococcus sp. ACT016 TaxID=3134808 RepID=UPI003D28EB89
MTAGVELGVAGRDLTHPCSWVTEQEAPCPVFPTVVGGPGVYRAYERRTGRARTFDDRITTADAVQHALGQLPEDFRVAIVLAEFADLPYADIAEHQQVSVATVKTRIHRARRQLADILAPVHVPQP